MQTIQFKIDNTSLDFIKTLLNNLKIGIQDLSIKKESVISKDFSQIDECREYKDYFNSKESEYIYYLIELDGEIRQKKLNITRILYKDKQKAKKWRDEVIKIIHPDKNSHPNATKSSKILNEIYEEMIKNGQ